MRRPGNSLSQVSLNDYLHPVNEPLRTVYDLLSHTLQGIPALPGHHLYPIDKNEVIVDFGSSFPRLSLVRVKSSLFVFNVADSSFLRAVPLWARVFTLNSLVRSVLEDLGVVSTDRKVSPAYPEHRSTDRQPSPPYPEHKFYPISPSIAETTFRP